MSDAVTIATNGELLVDAGRMGRTMAIGALGHHLVTIGMTGHTGNILMLEGTGHQQLIGGLVAGGTVSIGRFRAIGHGRRHVRLMTDPAISLCLLRRVRLMAFDTLGNHAMLVGMTEAASE